MRDGEMRKIKARVQSGPPSVLVPLIALHLPLGLAEPSALPPPRGKA